MVDLTGWSLFYGRLPGYTFANLIQAPRNPPSAGSSPASRTCVVPGVIATCFAPWSATRPQVVVFHGENPRHSVKVLVFDLQQTQLDPDDSIPSPGTDPKVGFA